MKPVCFALCVFGVIASMKGEMTEDQKLMAKMLHNNCVNETLVNEDTIIQAAKGFFPEDEKLKCYMKCVFVNMGVFSEEDSSIDKEAFIEMVPENMKEMTKGALEKCLPLSGDNACDMMFNLNKCFYNYDPKNFMII